MQAPTQVCLNCGKTFEQGYTQYFDGRQPDKIWHEATICDNCEQTALFNKLTADQQQQVDEYVYQKSILQGMLLLKRSLAIGLKESNFLFSWRYRRLREMYPRRFSMTDAEYWDGFYS